MNDFQKRISVGIDITRIIAIFWVFSVHYIQLPWHEYFAGGTPYADVMKHWDTAWQSAASAAVLGNFFDGLFLWVSYAGWTGNMVFFMLSGFSLWFSFVRSGKYELGLYFEKRFYGVYLPYVLAAYVAFYSKKLYVQDFVPGTYDIYLLLIGAARYCRASYFYNEPFWFLSILFILYLIFPFIVLLYKKVGSVGLSFSLVGLYYFNSSVYGHVWIFRYLIVFMAGIVAMEILHRTAQLYYEPHSKHKIAEFFSSETGRKVIQGLSILIIIFSGYKVFNDLYALLPIETAGKVKFNSFELGIITPIFLVSLSASIKINQKVIKVINYLAGGTLTLYLYHYLLKRIIVAKIPKEDFMDVVNQIYPDFMLNHFSVTFGVTFLIMLICCAMAQTTINIGINKLRESFSGGIVR